MIEKDYPQKQFLKGEFHLSRRRVKFRQNARFRRVKLRERKVCPRRLDVLLQRFLYVRAPERVARFRYGRRRVVSAVMRCERAVIVRFRRSDRRVILIPKRFRLLRPRHVSNVDAVTRVGTRYSAQNILARSDLQIAAVPSRRRRTSRLANAPGAVVLK